jgi:hypothetical protein
MCSPTLGMRNWYAGILRSVGKNNEAIQHPADGTQWKIFDLQYKPFASESRNIMFILSTDGMNPCGENRTVHNTWPVIFAMYNLAT